MFNIPNYQIGTQIYESANSLVYRGIRKKDNQPVILKILKEDYPTPEELTRYRQEYTIMRQLVEVDGVIKAYALEKHQNTLIIILEDFEAQSLKMINEQRTFMLEELLTVAIQTTDILGQIHRQNIIHKDINPSNIILNPNTGVLKIIDFGISTQLSRQHLTLKNPEGLEGTLAYISPEQTGRMNRALDYRTDFYSLGATFYELFTGKVPFESDSAMELVHCHLAKIPKPVCEINPKVPPIISDIVMKLMAKNAEARYQSAFGVKADLEKVQENLTGLGELKGLDEENLPGLNALSFELAQNDFSGKLQIPQKLYGRDSEREQLLKAFEHVTQGNVEMMLVAGYSGIGKSVLVKEIYKLLTEKSGYFIAGKFDQLGRNIPYSAVVNAFRELVQQLLTENEAQILVWKEKLLTALGPNGQIIIDVLPEIEWIIGAQPKIPQLGPIESQNRFNLVFQNFMQVFCQPEHPLVMFLDDLQWVDSATLKLLELVMIDPDNTNLYLIGAYRDNEVDPTHPLITTLDKLRSKNVLINQITLKSLAFEHINQLIAESLHHNLETVSALTDLLMRKTGGNPFFVNQFLYTLYEEELLMFQTVEQVGWQWDIKQIESLNITDNIVELMIGKLKKLPQFAQHVLRLAACIGSHFDLDTLSVIYEKSLTETFQDIMPVLTDGFILPSSSLELSHKEIQSSQPLIRHFRFLHDRVQQAAYALIADHDKPIIHLQIAHLLLASLAEAERDNHLFEIVNHWNLGIECLNKESEQKQLIQFNIRAVQKAKQSTAYQAALKYARIAASLLKPTAWQTDYQLAFDLLKEQAEAEYLNGYHTKAEQLIDQLLIHAQSLQHQVQSFILLKTLQATQGQNYAKGLKVGLQILTAAQLNFPESEREQQPAISEKLQEIQANIGGQSPSEFIHLPVMTETLEKVKMELCIAFWETAFYNGCPNLMLLCSLNLVNISLKYGNTNESSFGYLLYGVFLTKQHDYKLAYEFGELSLKVVDKFEDVVMLPKVRNVFCNYINHHRKHYKTNAILYQQNIQKCRETGEIVFGVWAVVFVIWSHFLIGFHLEALEEEIAKYLDFVLQTNDSKMLKVFQMLQMVVLNLQNKTPNQYQLKTELFDIEEFLEFWQQNDFLPGSTWYAILMGQILYTYGKYDKAVQILKKYAKVLSSDIIMFPVTQYYFYYPLCLTALYEQATSEQQQEYRQILGDCLEKLQMWADHCPENFQHKYLLVAAEQARIEGFNWQAVELYSQSIEAACQHDFIQNKALANELLAKFYLSNQMEKVATVYLKEAWYCYQQWGANSKVADLETEYSQWLVSSKNLATSKDATILATKMASTSTKSSSESLDLNSLMKAAQTLSEEIVLEQLLKKMMHIVIENAGASIGFLLLPQEKQWFIEAQGQIDSEKVNVLQSLSIENQPLAQTIVQYVVRTQENVVLHDASQEGQFIRDPYIVKHKPKSVLCTPLVNQGQISGILYLENNLTEGAFTSERIKVLNLLSSQLAISIENARLYTSISRFLPRKFLSLLDKKNIIDVQLGDQVEKEMSILFADIREFTSLSEKMSPQENFDFINAYLSQMAPIIAQYHGFIDKYIGDAIMALFPVNADDAVKAAIAMLNQLLDYNQERQQAGDKPIAIGIGLNTGSLMLGTVGAENRMDGTVISDAVNLASRIEGMTKLYGATLLISEETYHHLSDISQYAIRTIDRVKVKGKSEPVTIYEVFDADEPVIFELKMKTLNPFEKGLIHYYQKAFRDAIAFFEQVLSIYPDDKVAQIYLNRSRHWQKIGVPDDWEGVEVLKSK
jgi:predicted ATPase/class 3 adenylate cyclase/GAF domain-containing protein/tRNA A-37 threonylcarbamoyl transferase component Bud32